MQNLALPVSIFVAEGIQTGAELGSPIALVRPINASLVLPGKQRSIGEQNLKVDTSNPSCRASVLLCST